MCRCSCASFVFFQSFTLGEQKGYRAAKEVSRALCGAGGRAVSGVSASTLAHYLKKRPVELVFELQLTEEVGTNAAIEETAAATVIQAAFRRRVAMRSLHTETQTEPAACSDSEALQTEPVASSVSEKPVHLSEEAPEVDHTNQASEGGDAAPPQASQADGTDCEAELPPVALDKKPSPPSMPAKKCPPAVAKKGDARVNPAI